MARSSPTSSAASPAWLDEHRTAENSSSCTPVHPPSRSRAVHPSIGVPTAGVMHARENPARIAVPLSVEAGGSSARTTPLLR